MSKQSSVVDWIFSQLPYEYKTTRFGFDVYQQAKAMHKDEIKDAYYQGQSDEKEYWNIGDKCMSRFEGNCQQYYNETFGE